MAFVFGTAVRREGADHVVSVRDLPEVVTSGDTEAHALEQAADAIEVSIAHRMRKGEALPVCTPVQDGEQAVALSILSTAKASVYEAWREADISESELARRMGRPEDEVRRILDLHHGTRIERLEEAAKALGRRLTVGLAPTNPSTEANAATPER